MIDLAKSGDIQTPLKEIIVKPNGDGNNLIAAEQRSSAIQLNDILVGCAVAAILTFVNIVGGLQSGLSTFIPYDPIGNLLAAQGVQNNVVRMILDTLYIDSGLWIALTAAILRFIGDDFSKYFLMIFWHSAILLTISSWVGRYWASKRGVIFFVCATSVLSPLAYTLVTPVRTFLQPFGVTNFIWPENPGAPSEPWTDWVNAVLKSDLLAGTLTALSITLIALGPYNITRGRFVASGLAISLAVMAKGHFMPVYLTGWAAAIFVVSICLKEEGSAYAKRSLWALITMGPLLSVWMFKGAFRQAVSYIMSSYSHPLHNSNEYQQPLLGIWYYFYVGADAIGFSSHIVLGVALVGLIFGGAKINLALKAALPFLAAATVMAIPVTLNPFGKNFPNALPVFVLLWVAIIMFCGCILSRSRPSRIISFLVTFSCILPIALAAAGTLTIINSIHNKSEAQDVTRDREFLDELSSEIVRSKAMTIVTPIASTGLPMIFSFEIKKIVTRTGGVEPQLFSIFWNPNSVDGDAKRARARDALLSSDAVLVIPGGPKAFPFLSDYQEPMYEITNNIVSAPDSPFVLEREFSLGPTTAKWLYFPAGNRKMLVQLYVKRNLSYP